MKMKLLIVALVVALATAQQWQRRNNRRGRHNNRNRHRQRRAACPKTVNGHPLSKANGSPRACTCPHNSYLRAQRTFRAGTARTHWRRIRKITYYCKKRKVRHIATCAVTGAQAATRQNPHNGYCRCPKMDNHFRYFTHVTRHTSYSYAPQRQRRNRYGRGGNRNRNQYGRGGRGGGMRRGGRQQYGGGGGRRLQGGYQYGQGRRGGNRRGGNRRGGNRYGGNQYGNRGGYGRRPRRRRRIRHVTTSTYCRKVAMCPAGGQKARCYCPAHSRLIRKRVKITCPTPAQRAAARRAQQQRRQQQMAARRRRQQQQRARRNRGRGGYGNNNQYGRPRRMVYGARPNGGGNRRLQGRQRYPQYGNRRNRGGRRNNRRGRNNRRRPRRRRKRTCYAHLYSCQVVRACPNTATSAAAAQAHKSTKFCKCPRGTYLKRHMEIEYDYEGRRNKRSTVYYCDHNSMCPTHGYSKNYQCQCAPGESKEYKHIRRGAHTYFGAYCKKVKKHRFDPTRRKRHNKHSWCNNYHFINQCQLARGCTWDPHTRACSAGFSGDNAHGFHKGYIHRATRGGHHP